MTDEKREEGLSVEAEDRILLAVGKVETQVCGVRRRLEEFQKETNLFKLEVATNLATVKHIELNCPIAAVQEKINDLEKDVAELSGSTKRMSAIISGLITSIGGGIWALVGKGGS